MSPPISYYNAPWGRSNSDFDDASTSTSRPTHSHTSLAHPPRRRSESPPQPRSPAPQRGAIADLPSTRIAGYGALMRSSAERGFAAPPRDGVQAYTSRALPATPTSVVSVEEMAWGRGRGRTRGHRRASSSLLLPSPTSVISAREIVDGRGRVCAVAARRTVRTPSPVCIAPVRCDSPTLGVFTAGDGDEGRARILDSPSAISARSTVASFYDADLGAGPESPAWVRRVRKRAHWTLKWMEWYQED